MNNNKQSKKLAKILGEEPYAASPTTYQSMPSVPPPASAVTIEKPWYLDEDYRPEDILLDEFTGRIRAATLPCAVARLTPHGATGKCGSTSFVVLISLLARDGYYFVLKWPMKRGERPDPQIHHSSRLS